MVTEVNNATLGYPVYLGKFTGKFQGEILTMSSDILVTFTSSNITEDNRNNTIRRLKIAFIGGKLFPELLFRRDLGQNKSIRCLQ